MLIDYCGIYFDSRVHNIKFYLFFYGNTSSKASITPALTHRFTMECLYQVRNISPVCPSFEN